MAKKKQKKDSEKKKFQYSNEVAGILIVLMSIIGIGNYGPAGNFIRSFSVFLVGSINTFFLIYLLIIGAYLVLKRKSPNFFSMKSIGLYMMVICYLVYLHTTYITKNGTEGIKIITETFDNLLLTFKSPELISNSGGGMIGAVFSYAFYSLFKDGTNIVIITLGLLGLILCFNFSIYDLLNKIKEKTKEKVHDIKEKHNSNLEHKKENKEEVSVNNSVNDTKEDTGVVIANASDITHEKEAKEEENDIPINHNLEEKETNVVNKNYRLPPLGILKTVKNVNNKDNELYAKEAIQKLEETLKVFEITGKVVQVNIGPSVTQYELELKTGTKVSKLLSIQKEIALALAAKDVRIQAPIPGKNTIGIELPNKVNSSVSFKEVLSCIPPVDEKNVLAVGLGKDIMGKVRWMEINSTPHLLVAGATGSGKSVCMNCIIASILMRARPDQVKLVMVDPKKVELSMYNGIPHLLAPVVTDPKKASIALKNIVAEMERRYDILEHTKNKNIKGYNEFCETHPEYQKMPYIVVIIDELADLMLVAAKEVEDSIMRITQMARAAGIHLIVATQRPSTDVITGVVKANIPSRISFAVSSSIDSRTILDMTGAEKLLGKGDMFFKPMGENVPQRIQGAFVSEEELQKLVDYTISQQKAIYDESLTVEKSGPSTSDINDNYSSEDEYDDPLYNEIVEFAINTGKISASLIQRKYRLGYNRAARIIDLLEERGIIGPPNGSKPREVLQKKENNIDEE
ncbi:MAG: DNA translocase FtsK [Bacilli bacterium]|nr:DNA translocase FtsK [Bacilli bacterium]